MACVQSETLLMNGLIRALIDSRCAFTIVEGFVVLAAFATEKLLPLWESRMKFPDTESVRILMEEMESDTIGLNTRF